MAIENGASDIHINAGMPPIMRINTELIIMDLPEISNDDAGQMILEMVGEDKFKKFLEKRDWDFSTMIDDGSRFRVNAHFQRETFAISFRAISNKIPDIDSLHLPDVVKELTDLPRGLVVVTGHTGSGKSTTLASMINVINSKYRKHIITLEDPVEYMMENKSCMIEQREIGSDCPIVRLRPSPCPASGPRYHSRRRNARPGNHQFHHHRRRNRSPGVFDSAHH